MRVCLFLFVILLSACGEAAYKPDSTGRAGELVAVIRNEHLQSEAGEAIRNVFAVYQYGLPQEEGIFTLVTVPPDAFTKILQRHRNILLADISPEHKTPSLTVQHDVHSKNQILVRISAPDEQAFARIVMKNSQVLPSYFSEKELQRFSAANRKNRDKATEELLVNRHQISLSIPKNYDVILDKEDFTRLSYEIMKPSGGLKHQVIRSLFVYRTPYLTPRMFELGNLMDLHNEFTQKYIPGGKEGSYFKIVEELPPAYKVFSLNGNYAVEIRGLWSLEGDFMGGPFVNYTTVDTINNQLIGITGFVFGPNLDKREYLRELEGIMRTFELKPNNITP
jgi:hypothetical protein